jgi:hypothetical protein
MKRFEQLSTYLIALALLTAALPGLAAPARADTPTWQEEVAIEQSCEEWQKVQRCRRDDGEIGLECVAKSPFARFFSLFRGEREDDEVRVVVERKAPEQSVEEHRTVRENRREERRETTETRSSTTVVRTKQTTETETTKSSNGHGDAKLRIVREQSDLPDCRDGDR